MAEKETPNHVSAYCGTCEKMRTFKKDRSGDLRCQVCHTLGPHYNFEINEVWHNIFSDRTNLLLPPEQFFISVKTEYLL